PEGQALWQRACGNCHSNETDWPFYAYIAPMSWLTSLHVHLARQHFNMSDLNSSSTITSSQFPDNAADQIRLGNMPPKDYLILHPEARLTDEEKKQLIQILKDTLGSGGQ